MVLLNLKFKNPNDVKTIRDKAEGYSVLVLGTGDITSHSKEIDENSLLLSADSQQRILNFLGDLKITAELLSR